MLSVPEIDYNYCRYKLRVARSRIHRWGVYTEESIPRGRKVIEYTGEQINRRETKRRASERPLNYLFTLDKYWTIDGSIGGSGAQFINHSCEPNLVSRVAKGHINYYARRDIRKGEELTVDYHFAPDVEHVPCACGSPGCRGTINLLKK